jgi:hypothetical protein
MSSEQFDIDLMSAYLCYLTTSHLKNIVDDTSIELLQSTWPEFPPMLAYEGTCYRKTE